MLMKVAQADVTVQYNSEEIVYCELIQCNTVYGPRCWIELEIVCLASKRWALYVYRIFKFRSEMPTKVIDSASELNSVFTPLALS